MSIKVSSWVWDHSPYKGTTLLLHLALADFCDDLGTCYPAVPTLAHKSRTGERNAQTLLRLMETDGHLAVELGRGIPTKNGPTNRYHLTSYQLAHGVIPAAPVQKRGDRQITPGVQPGSPLPVQPGSPDPSVNPSLDPSLNESRARVGANRPSIYELYETVTGLPITADIRDELLSAVADYPEEWIAAAFTLAVERNARRWKFVATVLENWHKHGFGWKPGDKTTPAPATPATPSAPQISPFRSNPS